MAFDAHANFAYTTVAVAPSPPTSGTSLTVAAGTGALFPAAPFNCTVWPANPVGGLSFPTSTNAEIVRVTAIVGDVLTIIRTQEGTSARAITAGDQIGANITKKTITDIENAIPSVPSGANPTAVVGLSAVLGSATTYMRSDAAPPIDQTIIPTWTGLHTFDKDNLGGSGTAAMVTIKNSTAATSGVQSQPSPALVFTGAQWNVSVSQQTDWRIFNNPGQGIFFQSQIAGAGFNNQLQLTEAGTLTIQGGLNATTISGSFTDSTTNTATTMLTLTHSSSGTAAAGFGTKVVYNLADSTSLVTAHDLTITWATATGGSQKARVVFNVWDTAARNALQLDTDGANPTTTVSGTLSLAANCTLSGVAGTGALSLGSMTGNTTLPTGTLAWAGASGKTLSFASSGNGTVQITAGGATASLILDSGANLLVGTTNAQSIQFGNSSNCSSISFTVTSGGTIGGAANGQTIQNVAGVASGIPVDLMVCGRATLTSGIPVTVTDVTGALGGYYTPYEGNVVVLYDGTIPRPVTFPELAWLITDSSQTGGTLTGSTITGLTDTSKLFVGMKLTNSTGTGTLGASPTIATIASATSITISQGAGNVNGTLTNLTFKMPANSNLDWYGVYSSGSMVLRPGTLWLSQTAEADTVALVNGRWMNTSVVRSGQSNTIAANAGLRLFTVATNGTDGTTDDAGGSGATPGSRLLLNWYKPRPRNIQCNPGYVNDNVSTSYTASNTTWAAANAGTNATFKFLSSAEYAASFSLSVTSVSPNPATTVYACAGIGIDSSTNALTAIYPFSSSSAAVAETASDAPYVTTLTIGVHSVTLCVCIINGTGTGTYFADSNRVGATADIPLTRITGTVWT